MLRLLAAYAHQKRLFSGSGSSPWNGPMFRAGLPPGGFDLNHVGAQVGQYLSGQDTALVGQVQNAVGCQ